MISQGKSGWEPMLPSGVAEIIKEHHLFGYHPENELEQNNLIKKSLKKVFLFGTFFF